MKLLYGRLALTAFAVVFAGCAAGSLSPLSHLNSGTCGTIGGFIGTFISSASPIATLGGTGVAAAVCDAIAGYSAPTNTLSGQIEMPVAAQQVRLALQANEPAKAPPGTFMCPAGWTCTQNQPVQ